MMSNRSFKHFFITLNILLDLIAVNASILAAYWVRFHSGWLDPFALHKGAAPPVGKYIQLLPLYTLLWLATTRFAKTYDPDRWNRVGDIPSLFKSSTLSTISLICALFFYRSFSYSRWVIVLSWIFNIGFLWLNGLITASAQKFARIRGLGISRALFIGYNSAIENLIKKFQGRQELGYDVAGLIYVDFPANSHPKELKILGALNDLPHIIKKYRISEVFIASPSVPHDQILKAIHLCEGEDVKFRVMPDLYEIMVGKVKVDDLDGIPIVCLKELPLQSLTNRILKRCFDLTVGFFSLILLLPLIVVIGIAIKMTSKGPVIFKQERVGRNGKRFVMYKFRSMRPDAESAVGHSWAAKNDPRNTKVGSFLRRWSLDEIPQFVNVLKGDMSVVGPRPEMSGLVDKFSSEVPHYLERHQVKSGLTGWAQVNRLRGNTSLESRIRYDLYYIENWSVRFDLKILFKTISALGEGS